MPDVVTHGQTHRPHWVGGSDPATPVGYYEYKLYPDAGHPVAILTPALAIVQVGDGQFEVPIPDHLDGARLVAAFAGVSTAGAVTVQLRRKRVGSSDADMLSTKVTIGAGQFTSFEATAQMAVNPSNATVLTGDRVATDVDAADGAAKGLAVGFVVAVV